MGCSVRNADRKESPMNKKSSSSVIRQGSTPKRMEVLFESERPD